jgi:hypothetical protein
LHNQPLPLLARLVVIGSRASVLRPCIGLSNTKTISGEHLANVLELSVDRYDRESMLSAAAASSE